MSTITRSVRRVWRRRTGRDITATLLPAREWVVEIAIAPEQTGIARAELDDVVQRIAV